MVLAAFLPVISVVFSSLPEAVLGGCTIMMFGNIIVSGFQMIARAGFTQRNITIAALSLAVGIGFTQASALFAVFPGIVQSVFAQNCVAVVFLVAVVANLVLPRDAEAGDAPDAAGERGGAAEGAASASAAASVPAAASVSAPDRVPAPSSAPDAEEGELARA